MRLSFPGTGVFLYLSSIYKPKPTIHRILDLIIVSAYYLVKAVKNPLKNIIDIMLPAFYPDLCLLCTNEHRIPEEDFCLSCLIDLPYTDHFDNPDNNLLRHFWGRTDVDMGAALFDFRKEHLVRNLVHRFKYQHEQNIGTRLGIIAGQKYLGSALFPKIDVLVPVPTSRRKLWKRGFNQAEIFANGIHLETNIPIDIQNLIKTKHTRSQTQKSRVERLENVLHSFKVLNPQSFSGKNIMLVDDVLTTGATLEACIHAFREVPNTTFSIMTIGLAGG